MSRFNRFPIPAMLAAICLSSLLGGALNAQSVGLDTKVFGSPSGVPASAVNQISICATETSAKTMQVCLSGGKPGFVAGIAIGGAKLNVPFYSVRLLVRPDVALFKTFDAQGNVEWTFPLPKKLGLRVYVQGVTLDMSNPSTLFVMSSGIDVRIVNKPPSSTAFDLKVADILMDLSHEAYEAPVSHPPWSRTLRGKLTTGMKLAGGYQILTKIESKNPTSIPWFKAISWPDTQVFIAQNASGDLAIIFPGTDSMRDFATNLWFQKTSGFHSGFLAAYSSIQKKLETELKRVVNKHARVYITGHSLGGGLAPIAAYYLAPTLKGWGVPTESIRLYAFGCPRVMDAARAAELGNKTHKNGVPRHFAVVNKDDIVTHLPPASFGFTHIPSLRVFYPSHLLRNPLLKPWVSTRGTMFSESGSQYSSSAGGLLPGLLFGHFQDEYTDRIRGILPSPKVWLTVSSTGNMTLNWSFPERAAHGFGLDFIALYKGDPKKAGTNGYLLGQWKLASSSGSYVTGTPKGADFHIAYIQGYAGTFDRKFLATSGPYTWSKPSVSLTNSNGWVRLNWTVKAPGRFDYVALYNKNPLTAGPTGHILGQFQWATQARSWVSWRLWGAGYYVGYIEKDSLIGSGKVVAVWGPTR